MKEKLKTIRKQVKESKHLMEVIKENKHYSDELLQLNEALQKRADAILGESKELAAWVKDIEDPEMRDILIQYYIQGKTHEEIALDLGYARLTVLRKIKAFWNEQEDSNEV